MKLKKIVKQVTALSILFTLSVASVPVTTASAATLNAKQYIARMEKAQKKVKSYETKTSMSMEMEAAGEKTVNKATVGQVVFTKPKKIKSVTKATQTQGGKTKTDTEYLYLKDNGKGKYTEYSSSDGKTFIKTNVSGASSINSFLKTVDAGSFSGAKIVKKSVKVDGKNTVQIEMQYTGKDLKKALEKLTKESGGSNADSQEIMDAYDFESFRPIKATYWIDKKTYLPVKMTLEGAGFMEDLTNFFVMMMVNIKDKTVAENGMETENTDVSMEDMKITVKKFKVSTTYKNYNKAKNFKFPKTAL